MKFITLGITLLMMGTSVFAHNHDKTKATVGHDKEHSHVAKAKMDHEHDDAHHEKHNHKEHHPEHLDTAEEDKSR